MSSKQHDGLAAARMDAAEKTSHSSALEAMCFGKPPQ
jgi:hypothetical protein